MGLRLGPCMIMLILMCVTPKQMDPNTGEWPDRADLMFGFFMSSMSLIEWWWEEDEELLWLFLERSLRDLCDPPEGSFSVLGILNRFWRRR